ncbi:hypothetical protein ACP70R_031415 [Stipagrostis hirtigluma subsp. patula]
MEAVVVSSTEGVLRILLGKLGDVITDKYALLSGVSHEIQELKDDLESMNACLRDLAAGSDYYRSEQTRTWMKQVREVAYDAEDRIDTFNHHKAHHDWDSNLLQEKMDGYDVKRGEDEWLRLNPSSFPTPIPIPFPISKRAVRDMHRLGMEIRDLKARALKVSERRLRYKVEAGGGEIHAYADLSSPDYNDLHRRLPALNIDESQLIGMGDKTTKLINLMEDRNSARLRVISVVGFGGLGKTTLALTVYKSPEVKQIPARAFIAVSKNYNIRILLQSLLKQLKEKPSKDSSSSGDEITDDRVEDMETSHVPDLIRSCSRHLEDKRYFI